MTKVFVGVPVYREMSHEFDDRDKVNADGL